jgi:hypothetical protein
MTGEITLSGRVLPVGGIKEKVLAARRVGIRTVILPRQNEKSVLEDIGEELRHDLTIHLVSSIEEVLSLALTDLPAPQPPDVETDIEPLTGRIPDELLGPARETLIDALLAGETGHSDQHKIRRGAAVLLEWWRRSGGALEAASEPAIREALGAQLGGVRSWKEFLETPLSLEPEAFVSEAERRRLDALPSMIRLHGDAVPLEYEVSGGAGMVRLRLREGQARRLAPRDLPALDRPLRFAVVRGGDPPLRADSLEELASLLKSTTARARPQRHRHANPRRGGRRR